MTALIYPLLFFFAAAPLTLDQVRAETNPEHRAKAALDYAEFAERAAETAVDNNSDQALATAIDNMVSAMELARDSFAAAGKNPYRQPRTFKNPELRSHEMLHRLADLREKMDPGQRPLLAGPIMKIQAIHDAWFDGIMGQKK